MNGVSYLALLKLAAPETILTLTVLAVLFIDLGLMRGERGSYRRALAAGITCTGGLLAILFLLCVPMHARVLDGTFVVDPLTQLVKASLVVLTILTALFSIRSEFTEHVGEYFSLLLLATLGAMFMVSSEELLMIFVSLELTSVSLYILTAFNKRNARSTEAALKYFLFGSMAAAFLLFGLSLLYGLSGSTNLVQIADRLHGRGFDPLLAVALIMVVTGFGFKVAMVPFHLWAPDAYEGAPAPSAALVASGSKVASFFLFAKVMALGFAGHAGSAAWRHWTEGWLPLIAVLAVFSMLWGNLAAIAQGNFRRLIAYSAVAHGGYMLLGVLAAAAPSERPAAMAALVYYVMTYGLTTVGVFGFIALAERYGVDGALGGLAGFSRRAPVASFCLLLFLLSLAGIPPLAGFFGKFYLFVVALHAGPHPLGLLWLVIFALAMSVVSLYYYLQVLKQVYIKPQPAGTTMLRGEVLDQTILVVLAGVVLLLGALPHLLLGPLTQAIRAAGF